MMNFIKALSLILMIGFLFSCQGSEPLPNIILIVVDDMGWSDLGCYGNDFHNTPHIDRLAESGIRFTNAYATCPVCSPTRASIMTGKYPVDVNITDWIPGRQHGMGLEKDKKLKVPEFSHELALEEITIAERLKEAGYRTAHIGKWHLGGEGFLPQDQGFDINIAGNHRGSPASYFYPYGDPQGRHVPHLQEGGKQGEYLTDRLVSEAISFISEGGEQPFFLYLPFYTVHIPIQGKPEKIRKYEDKLERISSRWNNPHYAAMVESLDENVGRLIARLDELNISDNTFILFTSDNGGLTVKEGKHTPATTNYPLKAGKGYLYEGGIREPMIIRYPSSVREGFVSDVAVTSNDIYPTILELADLAPGEMDGMSLMPVIRGENMGSDRILYWHYPHYSNQGGTPGGAIRKGTYKLIEFFEDDHIELYNLEKDIGETTDIKDKYPEIARELLDLLNDWQAKSGAEMPASNPVYREDME
jgi:arylsulfatase A-like enzyme